MHEIIEGGSVQVLPLVFKVGRGARGFEKGVIPDWLRQHAVFGWFERGELEVAEFDESLLPKGRQVRRDMCAKGG
jgi:hypothetical protein